MTILQKLTCLTVLGTLAAAPVAAMAQQAGNNQSNGTTTAIGSDRQTGGATNADRQAVENIQDSIQRQRQMSQRP
jgi:hypothetical protein